MQSVRGLIGCPLPRPSPLSVRVTRSRLLPSPGTLRQPGSSSHALHASSEPSRFPPVAGRRRDALPWGFVPLRDVSRCVRRSAPPGSPPGRPQGFAPSRRPAHRPCGLISSRCHVRGFSLQGFCSCAAAASPRRRAVPSCRFGPSPASSFEEAPASTRSPSGPFSASQSVPSRSLLHARAGRSPPGIPFPRVLPLRAMAPPSRRLRPSPSRAVRSRSSRALVSDVSLTPEAWCSPLSRSPTRSKFLAHRNPRATSARGPARPGLESNDPLGPPTVLLDRSLKRASCQPPPSSREIVKAQRSSPLAPPSRRLTAASQATGFRTEAVNQPWIDCGSPRKAQCSPPPSPVNDSPGGARPISGH